MDPFTAMNQLGPIIRKIGEDFDELRKQAEAQTQLLGRIADALEIDSRGRRYYNCGVCNYCRGNEHRWLHDAPKKAAA